MKTLGKENNINKFKKSLQFFELHQPKECYTRTGRQHSALVKNCLKEFKDFNIVSLEEKFPVRDWCFAKYRHNFSY